MKLLGPMLRKWYLEGEASIPTQTAHALLPIVRDHSRLGQVRDFVGLSRGRFQNIEVAHLRTFPASCNRQLVSILTLSNKGMMAYKLRCGN